MSALAALAVLAAALAAFDALLTHVAFKRVACARAFSRLSFFEGDEGEMIEVVRNDTPLPLPWLRVESRISPFIRLGRQDNLMLGGGEAYACSVFTLLPFQQIRRRHRVRFLRRGAYELGGASLTAGDMLGLFTRTREQHMSAPVLIYPRLLSDAEMPPALLHLEGEPSARPQLLCDPFLVRGVRPYMPGDNVRDIHWPATARTGEAQVRLHDYAAGRRLLVALNGERTADQWGDVLMDYETGDVERAISVAATLCVRALRRGLAVGLACNLTSGEEKEPLLSPPASGPAREEELLAAFARLRHVRACPFERLLRVLPARAELERTDVVVLSLFESPLVSEAMASLRGRCASARLVVLDKAKEAAS